MRLYVIRHGIAEEPRSGRDADRALTADGARRVREIGAALARLGLLPARLASSPLLRARQTADALLRGMACGDGMAAGRPDAELAVCDALEPDGDAAAVLDFARRHCGDEDLALIGHLPNVALVVAAAIGAAGEAAVEMKKGGVAVIDFSGLPAKGRGTLQLLLAPRVLLRGD